METKKYYEQPKAEVIVMKLEGQLLSQSMEDLAPAGEYDEND